MQLGFQTYSAILFNAEKMSVVFNIIYGLFLAGVVKSDDVKDFQKGWCQLKVEVNELKEKILGNEEFDMWKPLRKIWCNIKFENEEYLQLAVTILVFLILLIIALLILKAICNCICGQERSW